MSAINSSVKQLKEMLNNEQTKELINFDTERQANQDMFLQLMSAMIIGNTIQQAKNQYNMPAEQNYNPHRYGMSNMLLDNAANKLLFLVKIVN